MSLLIYPLQYDFYIYYGRDYLSLPRICPPDGQGNYTKSQWLYAGRLRALKKRHPAAGVVCYVNTCAEIKAESDACCTPANAVAVVEAMLQDEIVFIPDRLVTEFKDREIVGTCNLCPCMKQIQLDDVLKTLKEPAPEQFVELPPEIAVRAREALDRMFVLEKNGSAILEQRGARGLPWIA